MAQSAVKPRMNLLFGKYPAGSKQIFMPDHVVTLLHKPHMPPQEAAFRVPLTFTKLDLRDYLANVYNVEVLKVRSYVKEQPLTEHKLKPQAKYRPQPLKIMNVELAEPFQWPEPPADLEPWNKTLWDYRKKTMKQHTDDQLARYKGDIPMKSQQPMSFERKELKKAAAKLLKGEEEWDNNVQLDPKWDDYVKQMNTKKGVDEAVVKKNAESRVTPDS